MALRALIGGSPLVPPEAVAEVLSTLTELVGLRITELVMAGEGGVGKSAAHWSVAGGAQRKTFLPDQTLYDEKMGLLVAEKQAAKYAAALPGGIAVLIYFDNRIPTLRAEAVKAKLTLYEYIIDTAQYTSTPEPPKLDFWAETKKEALAPPDPADVFAGKLQSSGWSQVPDVVPAFNGGTFFKR